MCQKITYFHCHCHYQQRKINHKKTKKTNKATTKKEFPQPISQRTHYKLFKLKVVPLSADHVIAH